MSVESNRVVSNEVDSNFLASNQGDVHSLPVSQWSRSEASDAFFQMMNQWFTLFVGATLFCSTTSNASSSPIVPSVEPFHPQNPNILTIKQSPINKIRKCGVE